MYFYPRDDHSGIPISGMFIYSYPRDVHSGISIPGMFIAVDSYLLSQKTKKYPKNKTKNISKINLELL